MRIATVGLDPAKNVFQVHGGNEHGQAVPRRQLHRDRAAAFLANLPARLVGTEACGCVHRRAGRLQAVGHAVRPMAPQCVKPYVKSHKSDAAAAAAICDAVARPSMCFVPIRNIEQRSVLALHLVRQGFVRARTARVHQIRGLLGACGRIAPQGTGLIAKRVPDLAEDASIEWPGAFRRLIDRLPAHLKRLEQPVDDTASA
ncbi:MAG: hypothetical protein C0505_00635 [Leptothrix sp. (in: Bacteria)]|nr:hypothetical protein [Leptothrix sp. (in: b-proteobacteria)]